MPRSLPVSGATSSFVKGSDDIYRCLPLQQLTWLDHGFATRRSANVPPVVTLRQIHSSVVWNASGVEDRDREGDALVSGERGQRIAVRTADCVPILLADRRTRSVAAIHAGWRGTAGRISQRAVEQMMSEFGAVPADIFAAIGPAIGVCCYYVGSEVKNQFQELFPEWGPPRDNQEPVMLDLAEANRRILEAAGLPAEQIFASGLCTWHRGEDFYSYRREPENPGRMISFIVRES
ncbi:MAG TPA: peptidoglycan editing factor PgeF [Bryobacteraceae bacterium]|nr:peptidoglycan editing factor PgeF [Bryobacteraceae bacterium]